MTGREHTFRGEVLSYLEGLREINNHRTRSIYREDIYKKGSRSSTQDPKGDTRLKIWPDRYIRPPMLTKCKSANSTTYANHHIT